MIQAYLEDQTNHLSKTSIAWSGLRITGQKMNNPSSFMYCDGQFCGLVIIHILEI